MGLIIQQIGHDGSSKPFPEPYSDTPVGFHSQECIEVLDSSGWKVTCIELYPRSYPMPGCPSIERMGDPKDRLKRHMSLDNGVLCGILKEEIGHAVSWINGKIHDPRGCGLVWTPENFLYKHFDPRLFFKVRR